MKKVNHLFLVLILLTFSSCDLIGGIFKAGMWSGVIVVVAIIALIIWLVTKAGRGKGGA